MEEENKDKDEWDKGNKLNLTPRDGQSQQYNASTPQTRGTRRRKIRDEEEGIAHPQKNVQTTQHPEENTTAANRSPYYRDFLKSRRCNIHPTDNDSHANAGLINSDIICYSYSILQVIASCIHLTDFFLSPPSKEHQRFRLYHEFANVIHSMVTGGPDVVNPTSLWIFSCLIIKISLQMNVSTCMLYFHLVVLLYCDIVVLSYWSVMLYCHIVVLLYCDIVVLSYCSVVLYCHIFVLLYCDIAVLSYCSVMLMMFLLLFVMFLSTNDSVHFAKHQRMRTST